MKFVVPNELYIKAALKHLLPAAKRLAAKAQAEKEKQQTS